MDIKDLAALLGVLIDFSNVADKVGRDTTAARWAPIFSLIGDLGVLSGINFSQALAEIKALDSAGKAQIQELIKQKLNLGDANLTAEIEAGIGILIDAEDLVVRGIAFAQSLKK